MRLDRALGLALLALGALTLPAASAMAWQDDDFSDLGLDEEIEGLEEEERGTVEVIEIDGQSFADRLAGLFVPGESGVLQTRQMEPEPRRLLRIGRVDLLPQWDESLVFDDNVFLTNSNEQDDTILRSTFGLVADVPFAAGQHRFVVGYVHERDYFTGGEAQNFTEHFATAMVQLNFNKLSIEVGNRYENRTDPILAAFTGKIDRELNSTYARARFSEPDWYGEVRVATVTHEYNKSQFRAFDRMENLVLLEYGGPMNNRSESFMQVGVVERDNEHDLLNDMKGFTASLGIRFRHSEMLEFVGRVGARHESYDKNIVPEGGDDETSPEIEARATWFPHQDGHVDFSFLHTNEHSPTSNFQTTDRGEVTYGFAILAGLRAQAGVGLEFVDPSTGSDFERYTARFGARYALMSYAHLTFDVLARTRNASTSAAEYDNAVVSLGAEMRF